MRRGARRLKFSFLGAVPLGVGARIGCGRGGGRLDTKGVGVERPTACGTNAYRRSSLSRSRPRSLLVRGWGNAGEMVGETLGADGWPCLPSISPRVCVLLRCNASYVGGIVGGKTGTLGGDIWGCGTLGFPPSINPLVPALCAGNAGTRGEMVGRKVGLEASGV